MARPVSSLLLLTLIATPAAGQNVGDAESWRIREPANRALEREPPSIDIGSYGRFGLGMFGLKPETPRNRAVTVREVTSPKQRRAGVGFSLKF